MWNRPIKLVIDKTLNYVYFMDKEHPLGDKKGRVWYHRHVMSIHLGRWLTPDEIVHHEDGNRQNNTISNLEVTTQSKHAQDHASGRRVELTPILCETCSELFSPSKAHHKYCSLECSHQGRKVFDPSK
jgi:hypothetical protein